MRWIAALAATAAVSLPGSAEAALTAEGVMIVGRAGKDQPWTNRPTEARLSDEPALAVIAIARDGKRRVYIADGEIEPLVIDRRPIRAAQRRPWSELGPTSIRWLQVEPHAWRRDDKPAANGATTRYHSNVSTESASFGKWLGYDEITYFETELSRWSSKQSARRRPAKVVPSQGDENVHEGLGTMRFKVEVDIGSQILASPGAEAVDRSGILPRVHRVSIRRDDTIVGHLTGYFLVPEVFGSAGGGANHQTERFTGADCADVLTGAARRAGFAAVWHTNVAGLTRYADIVAGPVDLDEDGMPSEPIRNVVAGDIIRIDYGGSLTGHTPRSWDHVALLFEDRSDPEGPDRGRANGALDGFDLVVHMGHPRLEVEPLSGQSPARVDVLRWAERRMKLAKRKGRR